MKVTKQWFPTYLELEHIVGDWRATVRLRHWRKRLTFKAVKIEKLSNRQNWRKTNLAKTDRNGLDPSR